ncbi:MAG TPA: class I SAM-dependent methyltransferase [Sphingomicrobium sp.]|nr:class I SAM-dependent methyltransferase [Sphingomicrobium sp.]
MSDDEALVALLRLLKAADYRFTAVTPATHARVLQHPCSSPDLRDIFGWNRWFAESDLDPQLSRCLERSRMLEQRDGRLRSMVRVASLGGDLFLHSAYPTVAADTVFFGPDTYRFARFLCERVSRLAAPPKWIVDMGAGSGAGAILAANRVPGARITAVDVNPQTLRFTRINAEAAGVDVERVHSSVMPAGADLVIANPPYIMDAPARTYRHGGELLGGQVALEWVNQALRNLRPGGTMLLYTGAAVVGGRSPLIEALQCACMDAGAELELQETDPDVFGEELDEPAYGEVERIALISAAIRK